MSLNPWRPYALCFLLFRYPLYFEKWSLHNLNVTLWLSRCSSLVALKIHRLCKLFSIFSSQYGLLLLGGNGSGQRLSFFLRCGTWRRWGLISKLEPGSLELILMFFFLLVYLFNSFTNFNGYVLSESVKLPCEFNGLRRKLHSCGLLNW